MILPHEDLIWVKDEQGRRVPFNARRLVESIGRAAPGDGEDALAVAEAIATTIQHFNREHAVGQVTSAAEIAEAVTTLLRTLGYCEWAHAYARLGHRTDIRLDEMAAQTATGFELGFYQQLDGALAAAADKQLLLVRMRGLRACVLRLRGARRWGAGCRRLAEEIVCHVHERVARLRPPDAGSLELAVMEDL